MKLSRFGGKVWWLKIETLLTLNRESRDQDLQTRRLVPAYRGGQVLVGIRLYRIRWDGLRCNGYQSCLSVASDLLIS
ncbi:hypothetical protein S-CBP3_0015 [Synechococcus phage S-CBP3]|uniref:Uncharacterized protein n=1 Tax=Synechococcus phage S-CBP3 TaxID=756276 RepID=A0A096VKJ5_9CAUD|nr:hypothetical protein S-CBP3_0015 [Synechococcus phage S-CBP3]AGK86572.1 hypothetical protein S-CBP3_0015 [Synechococcus phage S-CBP3]